MACLGMEIASSSRAHLPRTIPLMKCVLPCTALALLFLSACGRSAETETAEELGAATAPPVRLAWPEAWEGQPVRVVGYATSFEERDPRGFLLASKAAHDDPTSWDFPLSSKCVGVLLKEADDAVPPDTPIEVTGTFSAPMRGLHDKRGFLGEPITPYALVTEATWAVADPESPRAREQDEQVLTWPEELEGQQVRVVGWVTYSRVRRRTPGAFLLASKTAYEDPTWIDFPFSSRVLGVILEQSDDATPQDTPIEVTGTLAVPRRWFLDELVTPYAVIMGATWKPTDLDSLRDRAQALDQAIHDLRFEGEMIEQGRFGLLDPDAAGNNSAALARELRERENVRWAVEFLLAKQDRDSAPR